jgi:transposase
MGRKIILTQDDERRALVLRDSHNVSNEYRAALSVLLIRINGLSKESIASIFGVDPRTVYDDIKRIKEPESIIRGQWGGARNNLLTFEDEELFLDHYLPLAKEGAITSMSSLFLVYKKQVGKNIPKSTFYRMLNRHSWRMVDPDTVHPKANIEEQEEFKKDSKKTWRKLS